MDNPDGDGSASTEIATSVASPRSPFNIEALKVWIELVLAIATTAIAVVAYRTATHQEELSLRTSAILNFADVRPVSLLFGQDEVECENEKAKFGLIIVNYGTGPAVIRSVLGMIKRGEKIEEFEFSPPDLSLDGLPDASVLDEPGAGMNATYFLRRNHLLAGGSCYVLQESSTFSGKDPDDLWRENHLKRMRSLRVIVKYDSAAGPTCIADSNNGGAPVCTWEGKPFP